MTLKHLDDEINLQLLEQYVACGIYFQIIGNILIKLLTV